ncbi:MAG: class I SAM-dependent methyltransferase [Candidatus Omnitrophota bacterium]
MRIIEDSAHRQWDKYWRDGVESEAEKSRRSPFSLMPLIKFAEKIMKYGRYCLIRSTLRRYMPHICNKPVLDIGCGLGRTVSFFRRIGLKNTIGIDWSMEGLKVCQAQGLKINKDVFQMDCRQTSFDNGYFNLVFSEGILEHYEDFSVLVREMARISNEYVYILQPDHFSLCGKLRVFVLRNMLKGANESFPELSYKMEDFIDCFDKAGYKLILRKSTFLRNYTVLLFKKAV